MEQEILNRLAAQEVVIQKIYTSVEKTRKMFLWTLIITLVLFFLPLFGLLIIIPTFLSTLGSTYGL